MQLEPSLFPILSTTGILKNSVGSTLNTAYWYSLATLVKAIGLILAVTGTFPSRFWKMANTEQQRYSVSPVVDGRLPAPLDPRAGRTR
jgi:hypothetical protein